jgi:hypothetical protein
MTCCVHDRPYLEFLPGLPVVGLQLQDQLEVSLRPIQLILVYACCAAPQQRLHLVSNTQLGEGQHSVAVSLGRLKAATHNSMAQKKNGTQALVQYLTVKYQDAITEATISGGTGHKPS